MKNFVKGLGIGLGLAALFAAALYWAPGGAAYWIASLAPVTLVGFLLSYHLPEDNLKRWSKSHGIPITEENRALIVRHLTRGRRIRTAGAILGCYGYMIFTVEFAKDDASWGILRSIFFGYLIGAGIAEVWALRLRSQGARAASLTPREVRDYLPRPAMVLLRIATMATVILAISWEWIPFNTHFVRADTRPGVGWIITWAAVSLAVAVFVEVVVRRIVRRPQPAVAEELLRVDDAIRSSSIHQLAGAGLALVLGILAARLGDLTSNTFHPPGLQAFFGIAGILCGFGSIFAWLRLGVDQRWVVRRTYHTQVAA